MTQFVELIESGYEADNQFLPRAVARGVAALKAQCGRREGLDAEGVWRLDRREVRRLEQDGRCRPPGGWRALCSLAVGTGVLCAEEDRFVSGPETPASWEDGDVRRRLVESFTRWLIPPATAAGLFLAMGVHPLWGLRLARRLHSSAPMLEAPVEGWRDEKLLPDCDLDELRRGVFAALAVVVSGLRKLQPNRRYGLESLNGFVGEAMAFGRDQIDSSGEGLDVLIDDVGSPKKAVARSKEFAARELFDGVFVPAGVMRRYDDDTFAVDGPALADVQVGRLGADAQRTWLQTFLVDYSAELVA